jgi:hypothetical protein
MNRIEIDILSGTPNCPVVRLPHRKFPGVVIQGDSLRILLDFADEVLALCPGVGNAELLDAATALRERICMYTTEYELVMRGHGLELPYPSPRG